MSGGTLRIYLGAAPGVGKTFAMLNEGRRRASRGADVVVGYVETHGRARTAEQIGDLEVVPRRAVEYRESTFEEMDLDAVLARRPEIVLVDELAHTNVPGVRHEKRWQDVQDLLAAGIHVISTVNIQHLESVNDVVERITGVVQRETVPDDFVRQAEQVELVDMTPEALRRRMAHGNIYAPEKVDAALSHYFRVGNLGALRELALLWVADQVDTALEEYRERHGITEPWETRERIVVALTGAPGTEHLVRRAARIAQRVHGDLLGVHVRSEEGLVGPANDALVRHRELLETLGGTFVEIVGNDVAAALVDAARVENATQIVLGASRRSRWTELLRGSVINRVVRLSGTIDVHVISQEQANGGDAARTAAPRRRHVPRSILPPRRRALALALGAAGVPLLTVVLAAARDSVGLPTVLLLYLGLTVAVAAVGGAVPAVLVAVAGFLCANWYFTPPIYTWTIGEAENVLALVVFLSVAMLVSAFVVTSARRAFDAARASAEAETLARLAATSASPDPLPILVEHLRQSFALDGVALVDVEDGWRTVATSGGDGPASEAEATVVEPVGAHLVLALRGDAAQAVDRRVLRAFAASLAGAVERRRLASEASHAEELAEANELRSALLQAVSHDLRTPLASIKASVSSLRQGDVVWTAEDTTSFLTTIEEETDRLTRLVVNLLDMSRVSAGALQPSVRPVGIDEVLPSALAGLGSAASAITIDVPIDLRPALADPTLLERVLANVVENAIVHGAPPVHVSAAVVGGRVHVRVEDRGPGIPRGQRAVVLQPFQRSGDETPGGVGLGLAVASGFVRAMGGELHIEDTPGGGATVVVELDVA